MISYPSLVYIDTNVFLNSVLYNPKTNDEAKLAIQFLQKVVSKQIKAITSTLTWGEFVWIVYHETDRDISNKKGQEFLRFPNLIFEKVNLTTINRAQELLIKYPIRPRDGIHLATALLNDIQAFVTFDSDFDTIPELRIINLTKEPLK